jgi:PEP-CTERM motif
MGERLVLAIARVFATVVLLQTPSWADNIDPGHNNPPPAGAILDLNATPIPGGGNGESYQLYSVNFTAALANTVITFAFREDPAFISFNEASVTDLTHLIGNLLLNGNFQGGTYCDNGNCLTPVGWTYANVYGAFAGGTVLTDCAPDPTGNTTCWYDGAVQAYDAISQTITTTIGDTYQISFYVADNSGCSTEPSGTPCNFSRLSTNGDVTDTQGNGIDVLAYAQAGLPPPTVPEPSSLLMFGTGLFGLAGIARRKLRL